MTECLRKYRVEVAYQTKRGGVCVGMEVEAENEDAAQTQGEEKILKGYPARKWAYTLVSEVSK
jgi:hypothetical protein